MVLEFQWQAPHILPTWVDRQAVIPANAGIHANGHTDGRMQGSVASIPRIAILIVMILLCDFLDSRVRGNDEQDLHPVRIGRRVGSPESDRISSSLAQNGRDFDKTKFQFSFACPCAYNATTCNEIFMAGMES